MISIDVSKNDSIHAHNHNVFKIVPSRVVLLNYNLHTKIYKYLVETVLFLFHLLNN